MGNNEKIIQYEDPDSGFSNHLLRLYDNGNYEVEPPYEGSDREAFNTFCMGIISGLSVDMGAKGGSMGSEKHRGWKKGRLGGGVGGSR